MSSEDIGQQTAALCSNGDGINSAMAALAVVSGKELRRWQSSRDFRIDEDSGRVVVSVVDRRDGTVLRQMPSEEALRIARNLARYEPHLIEVRA